MRIHVAHVAGTALRGHAEFQVDLKSHATPSREKRERHGKIVGVDFSRFCEMDIGRSDYRGPVLYVLGSGSNPFFFF